MTIVSVVRDFEMYGRCVGKNPHNAGAVLHPIDNCTENKGIPTRYNEFLASYDYSKPDWLVFCHEDWEIQEDWQARLDGLDKGRLYGPIGTLVRHGRLSRLGAIVNSDKEGNARQVVGTVCATGTIVGVFDCQCLLVHSDLVRRHRLRFDERLSFDLYAEDFCICAKERHGIDSCVFQVKCQHYSFGRMTPRWFGDWACLKGKYRDVTRAYVSPANSKEILAPRAKALLYKLSRFLYYKKRTRSGRTIVKILKLPVPICGRKTADEGVSCK